MNAMSWREPRRTSHGDRGDGLVEVCPVPNPLDSLEQWESYHHLDLEYLTRFELLLTRTRLYMRLARDPKPHPWLLERLEEVQRRLKDER